MDTEPRIYIAIGTFLPLVGGAETQLHAHCRCLRSRGYATTIVTFHHDKKWPRQEEIEGVPVRRVARALLGNREKLPRIVQRVLYALALLVMGWTFWQHRRDYDIVQVSQFGLLVLPLALVCTVAHKPLVIVVVGVGMPEPANSHRQASPTTLPAAFQLPVKSTIWVSGDFYGLERFGKLPVRLVRWLLQRINSHAVVLSTRMKSYLSEHGFQKIDSEIIPNGVDIARFAPARPDLLDTKAAMTVVCVSRLSYEKGIDVLLQAWRLVHQRLPQARLLLIGAGPLQSQLESMAVEFDIADSVEFAGLRTDVPAQLHRGCIGILPSRCEGMPNALLEMMASGLASVATRVSGSEDVIQHEVNGLLIEPEDHESMAEALLRLLQVPALAQTFALAARATVEEQYSLERVAGKYADLYQCIASNQSHALRAKGPFPIPRQHGEKRSLRILMVTGIYPTERNPHSGTFIKTQVDSLLAAGLEVDVIHPQPGPTLLRYISAIFQVFFKTITGRFDIVHGHYGQWCLFARMQWRTPVVASFLGSDVLGEVMPNGGLSMKGAQITRLCRWLQARVAIVTVKSEQMKAMIPGENVIVSPDGINFTLFSPMVREEARAILGWDQHHSYVLFGNDPKRPEKNFPLAQAAIERLSASGLAVDLVVANGLPQTRLVQYINASNAVLLSSVAEGSPNIVKEAMACNVPVVATNVGDVAELIAHTAGCSACPHDAGALAEALAAALQHSEPTTGRADISHLDCSRVAEQIIAIYEQIITGKHSTGAVARASFKGEAVHG